MPFSNPIMGGQDFIRPVMSSPNFSIGDATGWAVYKNGNAYFYNITASGTITSTTVIVSGAGEGLFVYSGTPALGTLVASITNSPGTDDEGNAYLGGIVSYQPGAPATAAVLNSASLLFYSAPGSGGPWTSGAVVGTNSSASLNMSSGQTATDTTECILDLVPGPSGGDALAIFSNSGVVLQDVSTAPPQQTGVEEGPALYGSAGAFRYVSGADGNSYDTGRLSLIATGQNFTTAAAVPIAGIECNVAAGAQYRINGMLRCKQTTAAVADILGFSGGTATISSAEIQADNYEVGSAQSIFGNILNTLTTVSSNAYGINDNYRWIISGTITFATAGTFIMTGACTANGDDWGIAAGSWLDVMPIA
jgi:hypothetical protein